MLSLRFIFRLNQFLSESITGTLAPVTVARLFFHTLTHVMTHIRLMACQWPSGQPPRAQPPSLGLKYLWRLASCFRTDRVSWLRDKKKTWCLLFSHSTPPKPGCQWTSTYFFCDLYFYQIPSHSIFVSKFSSSSSETYHPFSSTRPTLPFRARVQRARPLQTSAWKTQRRTESHIFFLSFVSSHQI